MSIIGFINSIVFLVMFFLMMTKIKTKREIRKNIDYVIIFLLSIFILIFHKLANIVIITIIIIEGLVLMILSKILFEISIKGSLICSMNFVLGYNILSSIVYIIAKIIIPDEISSYNNLNFYLFNSIIINLIMYICIKNLKKIITIDVKFKYYIYIGLVIVSNILSIIYIILTQNYIFKLYENVDPKIISNANNAIGSSGYIINFIYTLKGSLPTTIVFCNVFLIIILTNVVKNMKIKSDLKSINDKLDMQYNYYLSLQESQMKVRNLYHDINNHLICINQVKDENVNSYIDSISKELKDFQSKFNTGNRILDIILNEKSIECKKNDIDFSCDINFKQCEFIHMIDVSSIFANILDNAIEACVQVENNRYIKLRGTIVKSYYVIKCENNKTNKIKFKNNKLLTSKNDDFLHGIGLQSVKSSLKKYDGELNVIDEKIRFIIKICIPLDPK
jgi:sensor histidine kinase YesM